MNVTDAIRTRRTIRKYKENMTIPREDIHLILEAAMMAPSACNTRPWEFLVIESADNKQKLFKHHPYAKHVLSSSVTILVCARPDLQEGKAEGFFAQDCGAAIQNILLQCTELGYGTGWCGIYPREERVKAIKEEFNLTSIPLAAIAIGYKDEEPAQKGFYDESRVTFI